MGLIRESWFLLQKEIVLEWRGKYALSGILLYVLSTVFIVYLSFIRLEPPSWNALLWIIVLFTSVNAVLKSFVQENSQRQLYYYTLANPLAILLAKMIYNVALLLLLSLLSWAGLAFVAGNPVDDTALFLGALALGSLGFSITLTFVSAIAVKADRSATLMAILSFPLVVPLLLLLVKMSATALGMIQAEGLEADIQMLIGIDLALLALSLVLYPYLWRD